MATVYRTLGALREEGWLVPVDVPQRGILYERAGLDHHHHFYCRVCNRLLDFPGCPLSKRQRAPAGFVLEHHVVLLYGLCRSCATGRRVAGRASS
jgi:Fur family ferric uptake transcriptional regulator